MNNEQSGGRARREALLKLGAIGALGTGGILGLVREALSAGSLPATPGMRHVRGPVTIDNQRATIGAPVRPGQTVTTGPGGEAIYILGSDAFMQRENTKVTFTDTGGVHLVNIAAGKLLSVFGRSQRTLQVATVAATIDIRGTGCYIEADDNQTYFCLCYGEAEVIPAADPQKKEIVRTEHHDKPLTIRKSGTPLVAPAQVINHTDAELILLENSVGRWPPFYGKPGYKPV